MKIHNKGQVVIPVHIRKQLGIDIGDVLEAEIVAEEGKIELRRPVRKQAEVLAGCLRDYARGKRFPTRAQMADALRRGVASDG